MSYGNKSLRIPALLTLLPLLALSACGPTVRSSIPKGGTLPSSIALLPSDYSGEIPRERVDLVRQALTSELRNNNFIVVEERAVSSTCSTPACPERGQLSQRYLIDGFVTLNLASFSRSNFIAGYYNELSGEIIVRDPADRELVSVEHSQNEQGGIVFQSGQLIQGIISQVKNSGDAVFENLAAKFSQTIVEQLPAPSSPVILAAQEGITIALNSASTEWISPTSYRICANGTPASFAYLIMGKNRTGLREGSPGLYCENLSSLVATDPSHPAALELRSAFGTSIKRNITLPTTPPCVLDNRLQASSGELKLLCTQVGSSSSANNAGCSEKIAQCAAERIMLFKAASPAGPYEKVADLSSSTSSLPLGAQQIEVVTVGLGGIPSLPVPLKITNK
jgi:hypothetical protein